MAVNGLDFCFMRCVCWSNGADSVGLYRRCVRLCLNYKVRFVSVWVCVVVGGDIKGGICVSWTGHAWLTVKQWVYNDALGGHGQHSNPAYFYVERCVWLCACERSVQRTRGGVLDDVACCVVSLTHFTCVMLISNFPIYISRLSTKRNTSNRR